MADRPASLDGTLINAVEPIPKLYRYEFIEELKEAGFVHLAASFVAHWRLQEGEVA